MTPTGVQYLLNHIKIPSPSQKHTMRKLHSAWLNVLRVHWKSHCQLIHDADPLELEAQKRNRRSNGQNTIGSTAKVKAKDASNKRRGARWQQIRRDELMPPDDPELSSDSDDYHDDPPGDSPDDNSDPDEVGMIRDDDDIPVDGALDVIDDGAPDVDDVQIRANNQSLHGAMMRESEFVSESESDNGSEISVVYH